MINPAYTATMRTMNTTKNESSTVAPVRMKIAATIAIATAAKPKIIRSIHKAAKRRPNVARDNCERSVPDCTSSNFSFLHVAQYGRPWIITTQSPQKLMPQRAQAATPSSTST